MVAELHAFAVGNRFYALVSTYELSYWMMTMHKCDVHCHPDRGVSSEGKEDDLSGIFHMDNPAKPVRVTKRADILRLALGMSTRFVLSKSGFKFFVRVSERIILVFAVGCPNQSGVRDVQRLGLLIVFGVGDELTAFRAFPAMLFVTPMHEHSAAVFAGVLFLFVEHGHCSFPLRRLGHMSRYPTICTYANGR